MPQELLDPPKSKDRASTLVDEAFRRESLIAKEEKVPKTTISPEKPKTKDMERERLKDAFDHTIRALEANFLKKNSTTDYRKIPIAYDDYAALVALLYGGSPIEAEKKYKELLDEEAAKKKQGLYLSARAEQDKKILELYGSGKDIYYSDIQSLRNHYDRMMRG
ncbi:hypothetical protein HYV44_02915 [Candidatus Microgenomates bacterium]|nr:hypothetical protein [Candidatus Microgenomates bacterium]